MKENTKAKCEFCDSEAFKTNGKSELICENRANTGNCKGTQKQYSKTENAPAKQRRNALCNCGSGKKSKKCCNS